MKPITKSRLRFEIETIAESLSGIAKANLMYEHTRIYDTWMLSIEHRLPIEMPESWYDLLWERVCNPDPETDWKRTREIIILIGEQILKQ